MSKIKFEIIIVLLFITGLITNLNAHIKLQLSNEQVILFTDRTIYVVNEEILFSGVLVTHTKTISDEISNVLYIELITPDGESIVSEKYKLIDSNCSGRISIPENLLTGYYFIKAYTKIMRNNGPNSYSYSMLKIINPYKTDLNNYPVSSQSVSLPLISNEDSLFSISVNKKVYSNREKVVVTLNSESDELIKNSISITVVPEFSYLPTKISIQQTKEARSDETYNIENNGISITGKLMDEKTGLNLSNSILNLSIIGKNRDFMATVTDSLGSFVFVLPDLYGQNNIFISSMKESDNSAKIMVLNDFCTDKISLKIPPFILTDDEKSLIYKLVVNKEIRNIFKDTLQTRISIKSYDNIFYGKPTRILNPDDFINLPTLEDCFTELSFNVKIVKEKDRKYFKITGNKAEYSIYRPLVLVDMVAITDYEKVLGISPQKISHIDVITSPYVKGSMIYGGIISIFSKEGNYGGINLPESGIFLNYNCLSESLITERNEYLSSDHPDTRNTILWLPGMDIENSKSVSFDFQTSDSDGNFLIIISAVKRNGEIVIQTKNFTVQ